MPKVLEKMVDYDITGFVRFPIDDGHIKASISSKTLIYLIAIDMSNESDQLSHVKLNTGAIFLGDDISFQPPKFSSPDLEEIIKGIKRSDPNQDQNKSINVLSSVLIGWSKFNFSYKSDMSPWICSFKDLTNEGRRLYYSIRKLHNESEIRLLTFNKNS